MAFIDILFILVPIMMLLALGYGTIRLGFLKSSDYEIIEKMVYFLFFPALLLLSMIKADFSQLPWGKMALVLILTHCAMASATLGGKSFVADKPRFASIFQCQVRWNSYLALALCFLGFGEKGLEIMALAVLLMTLFANYFSVMGFLRWGNKANHQSFWREMVKNPLILACLLGLCLNFMGFPKKSPLTDFLGFLGQATTALGLMAVGAGLRFSLLKTAGFQALYWSFFRLLGFPLIGLFFMILFQLDNQEKIILMIAFSTPTAASGYILAKRMGGGCAFYGFIDSFDQPFIAYHYPFDALVESNPLTCLQGQAFVFKFP